MKRLVESYMQFIQSASIAQDPRSYSVYGANPTDDRKTKVRRLTSKLRTRHRPHRKNLMIH